MRSLKIFIIVILFSGPVNANMKNAFDFKFDSIDGKELNLSKYKGVKILPENMFTLPLFETGWYNGLPNARMNPTIL